MISSIVQTELKDGQTGKPQRQKSGSYTLPNRTMSSTDLVNYRWHTHTPPPTLSRHFAVHPDKNIIYMCDRNPYRPEVGSICYVSTDGGSLWIGEAHLPRVPLTHLPPDQPKYIHNIVGFSPVTGRMYFQDPARRAFLSSTDGVRMEVLDPATMPDVRSLKRL